MHACRLSLFMFLVISKLEILNALLTKKKRKESGSISYGVHMHAL